VSRNSDLWRYIKTGRKQVAGWFSRCDAHMFGLLLSEQAAIGEEGSVVEIGVHHGKSFVPLAMSNEGARCYAIDIFERQDLNVDLSGKGDRDRFIQNIRKFGLDPDGVVVDARPSTEVSSEDILGSVGPARFFHIDGGHTLDAVTNDIRLADAVLAEGGIVAIDDLFRPEWPDVSAGFFSWYFASPGNLVPFAMGQNKTYLCRPAARARYQEVLRSDRFLACLFSKEYDGWCGHMLVFHNFPRAEWKIRTRISNYLKIYNPDLFYALNRLRSKAG